MKNIQVIDAAQNCVYDIFAATEEEFSVIYTPGQDVAFIDEVSARVPPAVLQEALAKLWTRRLRKVETVGIHGILFYQLEHKKVFYPSRRDEEATNADGSRLR
jgi:hypothetical protein